MTTLIDSHCHLDMLHLEKYGGDLTLALQEARKQDIEYFLSPGIDFAGFPRILQLAQQHHHVMIGVGFHPTEDIAYEVTCDKICQFASSSPLVVGIGETGLDYYHTSDVNMLERQQKRFIAHIHAARALKLPLIIHMRDAISDVMEILKRERAAEIGGVMHCFTADENTAKQVLELGFYISIAGIITFPKAQQLQATVQKLPLERLLLETDAPFLAPVPHRGQPNEPAYLRHTAEFVAKLRNESYATIADATSANFMRLFAK